MLYEPGQVVYISKARYPGSEPERLTPVIIQSGFIGKDGREWFVYERPAEGDGLVTYDIAPFGAFHETSSSGNNFSRQLNDPVFAKKFLVRLGLLDESGNLTAHYAQLSGEHAEAGLAPADATDMLGIAPD